MARQVFSYNPLAGQRYRRVCGKEAMAPARREHSQAAVSLAAPQRIKVGVLVDLDLTPDAGGHVKCWQRLAEAAVDCADEIDLTVHFSGPEARRIELSPTVRYV